MSLENVFLFIFGILFSHLCPRFSENDTHRRDFHIRKILLGFPPPSYSIESLLFSKLLLEKVASVQLSLPLTGLQGVSSFPSWGEFRGGKTMGNSALPVTLFSRAPLPPASSCYLLNSKVAAGRLGLPCLPPNARSLSWALADWLNWSWCTPLTSDHKVALWLMEDTILF